MLPTRRAAVAIIGTTLLVALGAAAQGRSPNAVAGEWRSGTVTMHVGVTSGASRHVVVTYRREGRSVPVREARWDAATRTLSFLLPGNGPPRALDHTDATTVELTLSPDGRRLAGRIVSMRIGSIEFQRVER